VFMIQCLTGSCLAGHKLAKHALQAPPIYIYIRFSNVDKIRDIQIAYCGVSRSFSEVKAMAMKKGKKTYYDL
jgi:hypothetical protein